MMTSCRQIDQAINLAIKGSNKIFSLPENRNEEGKLIVWMYDPLTNAVKDKINEIGIKLRYWHFKGSPHNPESSGYTCDECKVVLAFPATKTPRLKKEAHYNCNMF